MSQTIATGLRILKLVGGLALVAFTLLAIQLGPTYAQAFEKKEPRAVLFQENLKDFLPTQVSVSSRFTLFPNARPSDDPSHEVRYSCLSFFLERNGVIYKQLFHDQELRSIENNAIELSARIAGEPAEYTVTARLTNPTQSWHDVMHRDQIALDFDMKTP